MATLTACAATPISKKSERDTARRDVESYAIASCLTFQQQPYLRDQGDGWASAVIQRSKGELEELTAVANAVQKEVSKGNMTLIRVESGSESEIALPIAFCFDILNSHSVHAAVEDAIWKLAQSYNN